MKKKFYKTRQTMAETFDLPKDVILDMPRIIITGDKEITIENHRGVVVFEDEQVKVNSGIGLISIYGNNFEILFMGGSTITLGGIFKSVIYEGNGEN
ncbi:sporulation protein YqfC [Clostridium niameyense]|uniref:sporulation protein YqfC n=1 Tax=Clostridium niameyense TaxID=1622073 RepID=UPI00067F2062|nr:sporulation protein YqfC [Clostridium niameyense]